MARRVQNVIFEPTISRSDDLASSKNLAERSCNDILIHTPPSQMTPSMIVSFSEACRVRNFGDVTNFRIDEAMIFCRFLAIEGVSSQVSFCSIHENTGQ